MKKIKLLRNQNLAKILGILGVGGTIVAGSIAAGISANVDKVELLTRAIRDDKLDEFQRANGDIEIVLGEKNTGAIVRGKLFMWGNNGNGELGLGNHDRQSVPKLVSVPGLVTKLALGGRHSAAVVNGDLYMWGSNEFGQLGIGDAKPRVDYTAPEKVILPAGGVISQIALGENHSGAVVNGELYMWGRNNYGQLGLGNDGADTERATPEKVAMFAGNNIINLKLGYNHTGVITATGDVWTWGRNDMGQLGINTQQSANAPQTVTVTPSPIGGTPSHLALGADHSGVVGNDGILYMWGQNDLGQLGVGDTTLKLKPTPTLDIAPNTVTELSLGGASTGAIVDGKLLMWGGNYHYQMGAEGPGLDKPTQVQQQLDKGTTTQIALGGSHSGAIIGGMLYMWGNNIDGQLGNWYSGSAATTHVFWKIDAFQFFDITLNNKNDRDNLRANVAYNVRDDKDLTSLITQAIANGEINISDNDAYSFESKFVIGRISYLTPEAGQVYVQINTDKGQYININFNGFKSVNDTVGITIPERTAPTGTLANIEINDLVAKANAEPTGTKSALAEWIIQNQSEIIGDTTTFSTNFPVDAKITKVDNFKLVSGIDGTVSFNITVDKYYKTIGTNLYESQWQAPHLRLTNSINLKGLSKTQASKPVLIANLDNQSPKVILDRLEYDKNTGAFNLGRLKEYYDFKTFPSNATFTIPSISQTSNSLTLNISATVSFNAIGELQITPEIFPVTMSDLAPDPTTEIQLKKSYSKQILSGDLIKSLEIKSTGEFNKDIVNLYVDFLKVEADAKYTIKSSSHDAGTATIVIVATKAYENGNIVSNKEFTINITGLMIKEDSTANAANFQKNNIDGDGFNISKDIIAKFTQGEPIAYNDPTWNTLFNVGAYPDGTTFTINTITSQSLVIYNTFEIEFTASHVYKDNTTVTNTAPRTVSINNLKFTPTSYRPSNIAYSADATYENFYTYIEYDQPTGSFNAAKLQEFIILEGYDLTTPGTTVKMIDTVPHARSGDVSFKLETQRFVNANGIGENTARTFDIKFAWTPVPIVANNEQTIPVSDIALGASIGGVFGLVLIAIIIAMLMKRRNATKLPE